MEGELANKNPHRYKGRYGYYYDTDAELYLLSSRWYNPEIRRFMTRDEYRGEIANPISMHRYAYCANDPVNYVDPMGTNPVYATINGGGGGTSSLGNNYKPVAPPLLDPMWAIPDLGSPGPAPAPTSGTKTTGSSPKSQSGGSHQSTPDNGNSQPPTTNQQHNIANLPNAASFPGIIPDEWYSKYGRETVAPSTNQPAVYGGSCISFPGTMPQPCSRSYCFTQIINGTPSIIKYLDPIVENIYRQAWLNPDGVTFSLSGALFSPYIIGGGAGLELVHTRDYGWSLFAQAGVGPGVPGGGGALEVGLIWGLEGNPENYTGGFIEIQGGWMPGAASGFIWPGGSRGAKGGLYAGSPGVAVMVEGYIRVYDYETKRWFPDLYLVGGGGGW